MSTAFLNFFSQPIDQEEISSRSAWTECQKFLDLWETLDQKQAIELLRSIKNGAAIPGFPAYESVCTERLRRWGADLIQSRGAGIFVSQNIASIPFSVAVAREGLAGCLSNVGLREKLFEVRDLVSPRWIRTFVFDILLRDFETHLFGWDNRSAHRVCLSILIKIALCEQWLG